METPTPGNASLPQSWAQGGWGTNSRSFSYPTGGAHSGDRYARVALSSYTSGDAKWWFPHVNVQPNTSYTFRDFYRSTVTTQLVAEFRSTAGVLSYSAQSNLPPSTGWSPSSWTFTTPANTASVTIYHVIAAVGTLDTDDAWLDLTNTPPTTTTTTSPTTTLPGGTTTTAPGATTTTAPPSNLPVLYLTFDDGPGPDYTPAMLDMLDRHGVKATFFVIGRNVRDYPGVVAETLQRGHKVGNHTDTHPDLTTLTANQIANELDAAENSIFAATGTRPSCMRPPYGYLNSTATNTIASLGYSAILWTQDTTDWDTGATSVQSIVNTLNTASNNSIVLMHDFAPNTIIAVDQWLTANASRFQFRTIPSC
jgi:peptidoglycan-N-acetylglucosamine deacetylase